MNPECWLNYILVVAVFYKKRGNNEVCERDLAQESKESYRHINYNRRSTAITEMYEFEIATWARHVRKWKSILELKVFKAFLWNAGFKDGWSRTDVSYFVFTLEPMSDNWYLGHLLACFYYLFFFSWASLLAYIKILINSQILCMKNYSCLNDDIFVKRFFSPVFAR